MKPWLKDMLGEAAWAGIFLVVCILIDVVLRESGLSRELLGSEEPKRNVVELLAFAVLVLACLMGLVVHYIISKKKK